MSSNAPQASTPEVSVLVVFRNEARHIEHCIASIEAQFEPGQAWELLLIDGCSTDNSRELVEQYFANRSDVRWQLIHNPDKTLATGWNLGIQAASGTYIIRPDAHAALHPGYIGTALKVIEQKPDVAAVGGTLATIGKGWWGRIIQEALSSKVGVGNSGFRTGAESGYADTAVYGLYRKKVYDQVGLFDASLVRHQDTEFHGRVTAAGWKFWLESSIAADYYCRDTVPRLITHLFRIGYYLPDLMGQRGGLRPRHLAPFVFFAGLAGLFLLGFFWMPFAYLGALGLGMYSLAMVLNALSKLRHGPQMLLLIGLIPLMHLAYAWGTFRGLLRQLGRSSSPKPSAA